MARKPARATAKRRSPETASETSASDMSERHRIIQAFLALLAELVPAEPPPSGGAGAATRHALEPTTGS